MTKPRSPHVGASVEGHNVGAAADTDAQLQRIAAKHGVSILKMPADGFQYFVSLAQQMDETLKPSMKKKTWNQAWDPLVKSDTRVSGAEWSTLKMCMAAAL